MQFQLLFESLEIISITHNELSIIERIGLKNFRHEVD